MEKIVNRAVDHILTDQDYTLTDFQKGHVNALDALADKYGPLFADYINLWFNTILHGLRIIDNDWSNVPEGKKGFEILINELMAIQGNTKLIIWSRELAAIWAAQRAGITILPDQAIAVADLYWESITQFSEPYQDTLEFLKRAHSLKIPYHVFSSSDGRLRYEHGHWLYDASYSLNKKLQRMNKYKETGIKPASITIGDPIDKPEPQFYSTILMSANSVSSTCLIPKRTITIGDSYQGDVLTPTTLLGLKAGYWINRTGKSRRISQNIFSITSLLEIPLT